MAVQMLQHPTDAAMRQAQTPVTRRTFGLIEPVAQVLISLALCQRRWQDRKLELVQQKKLWCIKHMHIIWNAVQAARACPDTFAQGRVMVAGQEQPGAGETRHGIETAAQIAIAQGLRIKDIARYHKQIGAMFGSQRCQLLNGLETCLSQGGRVLQLETRILATYLPIGCMQDS